MESVLLVVSVLSVLFIINWRRHQRDMRLRAERVRARQQTVGRGTTRNA